MIQNASQFKTLAEFIAHFKDEETCQAYFAKARFANGEYCPHCGHTKIHLFSDGRRYRCAGCKQDFTIKTNTVFGESKLPLQKWFIAIWLLSTSKKGISSVQLSKQLGVTQKTAWHLDHRLRSAIKATKGNLFGTVEVDETYIGGKEKNKHARKRVPFTQGRSTLTKTPIIGLVQRGGEVRAKVVEDAQMLTVEKHIVDNVKIGTQLYTDEYTSYSHIGTLFPHKVVRHGRGEYVTKGDVHSNTIESFWALFKRGHYGIYHSMSRKHLQRYVDEFVYRFNQRANDFQSIFSDIVGRVVKSQKLGYKTLTQNAA